MALRVFPENLSSIGPEIDFLKSNKVLEKKTECTVRLQHSYTFVRMRSGDHLGDAKMSKKGTSFRQI